VRGVERQHPCLHLQLRLADEQRCGLIRSLSILPRIRVARIIASCSGRTALLDECPYDDTTTCPYYA
jgi:hypothetical protein